MLQVSRLTTVEEVESVIGRPPSVIMLKQVGALDDGCRTILARSPIAAFGYRNPDGTSRTTFIGGTPGFARVHSPTQISFTLPEPGEPYGGVSLFFLLPGIGEILRVNGTAAGTRVDIEEIYVHCAQAVLRSGLWQPPAPATRAREITGDGPLNRPEITAFLAAAPFLALSTWDGEGGSDTSPRGDTATAARVLDGRTLVIPDRKGNKRADTLHNLLRDDRLSLAALVPGRSGVLHVRGRGAITDDPALLATMALRGMAPHAALVIDVEHAELTTSDPVAASRLWTAGAHVDRDMVPDLMALAAEQLAANAAKSKGSVLAYVMKVVTAIPGIDRVMRFAMNRAYLSGLRKEGYEGIGDRTERQVRVVEVRRETPSAVTLVLQDGRGSFDFRPGQFFTLGTHIDGQLVRRAYSASSAPGSARLEVTVKHVEGGRFSGHVHRDLRAGDSLTLLGPAGSFHAETRPPEQVVLIAAGSGITPMMSMIRARRSGRGRMALLYGNRSEAETIFADELARLETRRFSVTHVLGRLTADRVRSWVEALPPAAETHYYICGPEGLMDLVREVLSGLGIPDSVVHHERFSSPVATEGGSAVPQSMTVNRDGELIGTAIVEPGQTLLEAGLAAGLPMPYACTVGSCGTCSVKLDGAWIATCTSRPLSDVVLELPG